MKKITYAVLVFSMWLTSCTKDFTTINTNPNTTTNALPQQLLAPALVSVVGYNMNRNRSFNNELMQVTVDMGDGDGKIFRYDIRASTADYAYNGWYLELTNFKDLYKIASKDPNYNKSYMGISLICQSWIYSMLTDTYGDIPYFKSNLAKDSMIYEPPFDKQKDIYADIFQQLETANTLLSSNTAITASSDPVFGGNISKWRKFGNSLYLRLLLRLSGKAEVADLCIAKIKQIVNTNPGTYPIMTSNDESAILRWTGAGPYVSPFMSVREQDFRSPAIGSFFIEHLAIWNDPRVDIPTYGSNSINRWGIAPYSGSYQGVPSGYIPGQSPVKKCYFYSTTSAVTLMNEPMAGMIMNYAELNFILAEAAVKGWITGSAQTYYENGAQASITQWLPQWSVPIKQFLSDADIQWDDTAAQDDKMELIHLQKYYALFLTDMQQWFEYRRTGHPILPKGPGLKNNGIMPARMNYPVYVQSTNPTNYKAAVAAQGPDVISTQVWWQKP
ncbi:SusD/RagB family nutrient-binding outer membrane lipoprotein [Chitinophaga sp. 30R24]|uniref:SusD/RagB family nutrient-binding outer membrane lipoprotein n=1 Tax=Chitinophaga sp. 30R24 TaxID=3248838 RepID=UPI003B919C4B